MLNIMNIAVVADLGFDEVSWNKVRMGESVVQWHTYLPCCKCNHSSQKSHTYAKKFAT